MAFSLSGLFKSIVKGLNSLSDSMGPYYSPINPEPKVMAALEDQGYKFRLLAFPPQMIFTPVAFPPVYSARSPEGKEVRYNGTDEASLKYRAAYDSAVAKFGTAPKIERAPAP